MPLNPPTDQGSSYLTLPQDLRGETLAHLAEGVRLGDPLAQGRLRRALLGPLLDALMSTGAAAIAAEAATVDALEAWFDQCQAAATLDPRRLGESLLSLAHARLPDEARAPLWPDPAHLRGQLGPRLDPTDRLAFDALGQARGRWTLAADMLGQDPENVAGPLARMRQAALHAAAALNPKLAEALALDAHQDDRADPLLQAFIDGEVSPGEARELTAALTEAPQRRRYEALVFLEQVLEGCPGASLSQQRRLLSRATDAVTPGGRSRAPLILGVGLALIAAMSVLLFIGPSGPEGLSGVAAPSMSVLRAGDGEVARLNANREGKGLASGDTLAPGEGLYFAYGNPPESPYRHWMIAGRDAEGALHWYHPRPRAEPRRGPTGASTFILKNIHWRPLRRVVYIDHPPGPLEICAMFFLDREALARGRAHLERAGEWPQWGHRDCRQVEVLEP